MLLGPTVHHSVDAKASLIQLALRPCARRRRRSDPGTAATPTLVPLLGPPSFPSMTTFSQPAASSIVLSRRLPPRHRVSSGRAAHPPRRRPNSNGVWPSRPPERTSSPSARHARRCQFVQCRATGSRSPRPPERRPEGVGGARNGVYILDSMLCRQTFAKIDHGPPCDCTRPPVCGSAPRRPSIRSRRAIASSAPAGPASANQRDARKRRPRARVVAQPQALGCDAHNTSPVARGAIRLACRRLPLRVTSTSRSPDDILVVSPRVSSPTFATPLATSRARRSVVRPSACRRPNPVRSFLGLGIRRRAFDSLDRSGSRDFRSPPITRRAARPLSVPDRHAALTHQHECHSAHRPPHHITRLRVTDANAAVSSTDAPRPANPARRRSNDVRRLVDLRVPRARARSLSRRAILSPDAAGALTARMSPRLGTSPRSVPHSGCFGDEPKRPMPWLLLAPTVRHSPRHSLWHYGATFGCAVADNAVAGTRSRPSSRVRISERERVPPRRESGAPARPGAEPEAR